MQAAEGAERAGQMVLKCVPSATEVYKARPPAQPQPEVTP